MTAPYGYIDANLAKVYGVTRPAGSTGFVKVELDGKRRAGVLTQAGFLTIHTTPGETSPPQRGKAVLVKMLCMDVPPPIDNLPEPPAPTGPETTRQRFERITAPVACVGCHRMLNPLGFAFESYDTLGQFRTVDNTLPVNTTVDLSPFPGMGDRATGAVKAIPECTGTVFDNTVILWCAEMSHGNHWSLPMPWVILGGGWHFKTGRFVDLPVTAAKYDNTNRNGTPLVSIAQAMGHRITTFGRPDWCNGPEVLAKIRGV